MTPAEFSIVKSLIVVAWADGQVLSAERGVIEGLMCGFDASEEEEAELLEFARTPRTLTEDLPLSELGDEERDLLLENAVLLCSADGETSETEHVVLSRLRELLGADAER